MSDCKIFLFIISVVLYCMYSVHHMFVASKLNEETPLDPAVGKADVKPNVSRAKRVVNTKSIPLFLKDACSALEVFTKKPFTIKQQKKKMSEEMDIENNAIAVIGITMFLVILVLNALFDVLKVKEEERAQRKLNPDGERRQSLSEFANKKPLRRESSRFNLQLFQIAESTDSSDDKKVKSRREVRPYTRGESINSYLSEKSAKVDKSAPASVGEVPNEPRLVKRQSVAKLIGARPPPMVRRSSYPALPLNPEIQALMLGSKQSSFDSDDEGDGRGRRVRIIRRF